MSNDPLTPQSKLPNLGTTIFTQTSILIRQHQAVNLSQEFPDFDGPPFLQERRVYHVVHSANQHASMTDVQPLHEVTTDKAVDLYGYKPDVNSEVTIAAGTTEVLYAAIVALVRSGDEMICFDPSYGSYMPAVELSGGAVERIAS